MGIGHFFTVFKIACRSFVQAFKHPEKAQQLIEFPAQEESKNSATSHLKLLAYLQHSGRLVDFLKEEIQTFSDAQIGLAVRKIHQECAKSLEELVTVRPLIEEAEGATIQIPKGYNPLEIKVVGNVQGEAPFTGTVMHRGWKAHKLSLPHKLKEGATGIICPAEVEIK